MSQNRTSRNLTAVLAIVVLISLIVAAWPFVSPLLNSDATRVEPDLASIEVDLPFGGDSIALSSLSALGILAGITLALVAGGGLAITGLNMLLSRQVSTMQEDEGYQAGEKALAKLEKDRLNNLRVDRTRHEKPDHSEGSWLSLPNALIILGLVVFFGMYLNGALVPSGELVLGGSLISSATLVVGALVAVTAVVLFWFGRPQFAQALEKTPGDFIWALVSGLVVVGLGLALVAYLNAG
ncbi:MAG: hypothetical protein ACE5FD_14435 [Anaerolineae bacterium]